MHLFWHQRDLRIPDNRGLAQATHDGATVPVYVVDETLHSTRGRRQQAFFAAGLARLKERYRALGSDLLVRHGSPATVLESLQSEYGADRVYYNRQYDPARRDRQQRVDAAMPTTAVTDLVVVDPEGLDARYPNHGRFAEDWAAEPKPAPTTVSEDRLVALDDDTEPPSATADIPLPEAGYAAARERYDQFLASGIERYRETRDDMAQAVTRPVGAVSRLSPYLAAGMIGIREVWADASKRYDATSDTARRNVAKFRDELTWREQYYHLLANNPTLLEENYRSIPNEIEWHEPGDQFEAWKRGETGYPLVDAGMRQLNAEGYIHNRPRQVVASFLTKHLLIDWRLGADHFRSRLLDYDPASNAGNWQWIASTGTDSVDIRIFDPVAQLSKYDPEATYVTEYVPELRGLSAETIIEWPRLDPEEQSAAPAYPQPIVDRDRAYERAQRTFERALGKQ